MWHSVAVTPEDDIARVTARYPAAEITPAQFEEFVADLLATTRPFVQGLRVTLHDKIESADGTYDFDATIRFCLGGMNFLVIVEAKRYKNSIKRELVQVLDSKRQSVGAQKAVMISTAPYQSGALKFAKHHGVTLVTVTEDRFTYETRTADQTPVMSREQARDLFGIPEFVGHAYLAGEAPEATSVTLLSPEYPEYVTEALLGVTESAAP
jgi:hypothetical protein